MHLINRLIGGRDNLSVHTKKDNTMNLESIVMSKPDVDNMEKFIEEQSQALAHYLIEKRENVDKMRKILDESVRTIPYSIRELSSKKQFI